MSTYCNHLPLGTLTTETPAVVPTTLYPRLSMTSFSKLKSAAAPPSPPPSSLSSSSTPLCLPTLKPWNSLSLLTPSTVQTTTPCPSSQGDNSTSKMPFVSLSWANASFLNVKIVDSIDADPFLEKRHDDRLSTAAAASLLDAEAVLRMRPERIEEDEDDGMLSDCEESDTDTDQGLDGDDYGDLESVDIHNADVEDNDSGYFLDAPGVGAGAGTEARAGAGGAQKAETIGAAYQDHKMFGESQNSVSGDEEERQRIEKLTQGIMALQLDTSNTNDTCSHRVDISKTKSTFLNLEYGYQGPPPSPSWLSSPRSETESISSSSTATSISTLVNTQNNGVTVRGSYVIIKMPKNREPVVTMPEGFSSVAIMLSSTAVEESDDVEEKEVGKKRSSGSLKTVEGPGVSPKKRR